MSLIEALINAPLRETAGSKSSRAFDYQKDWTLCKLLELHETGKDYVVLCEYHDDTIILDSTTQPNEVRFFQVKTKKAGYWTLGPLLTRRKGRDGELLSSILGRLFQHRTRFGEWLGSLNLVSNARFHLNGATGKTQSSSSFTTEDLSETELDKLSTKLALELGDTIDNEDLNCVFQVSALSLEESETHAKGRLGDFLERNYKGDRHPISSLYKTLFGEIKRRTNYSGDFEGVEGLISKKGVSRELFGRFLESSLPTVSGDDLWVKVEAQLQAEGVSFSQIHGIRQEWRNYEIARLDPTNESLQKLETIASSLCAKLLLSSSAGLMEIVKDVLAAASSSTESPEVRHLRAITLWILHEESELQKTSPKPPKEKR